MKVTQHFDFSDVNLIPQLGIVNSRSECQTQIQLGYYTFKVPVLPSNMESVINPDVAYLLANNQYFYTMHRFLDEEQIFAFIKKMMFYALPVSISVGVGEKWKKFIDYLDDNFLIPDYITIDIAHGHSLLMRDMIFHIKSKFKDAYLIGGNISTVDAANDLASWGVNAVKVGIAPGLVCTTAMATGFGSRGIQASTIKEISEGLFYENVAIIADGGIRNHGDIAKALVLGADMVMAGSLFAGFNDSYEIGSNKFFPREVDYWGSASSSQSGKTNRIEGTKTTIPFKNRSILTEFIAIEESLQSSISYAGGKDLNAFLTTKYKIIK